LVKLELTGKVTPIEAKLGSSVRQVKQVLLNQHFLSSRIREQYPFTHLSPLTASHLSPLTTHEGTRTPRNAMCARRDSVVCRETRVSVAATAKTVASASAPAAAREKWFYCTLFQCLLSFFSFGSVALQFACLRGACLPVLQVVQTMASEGETGTVRVCNLCYVAGEPSDNYVISSFSNALGVTARTTHSNI
jgi:hypothetical protein